MSSSPSPAAAPSPACPTPASHAVEAAPANQQAITQLTQLLMSFAATTQQRLEVIESGMSRLLDKVDRMERRGEARSQQQQQQQQQIPPMFAVSDEALTPPSPCPLDDFDVMAAAAGQAAVAAAAAAASAAEVPIPIPTPARPAESPLRLRMSAMESRWYTKRAYPDFEVHVVDAASDEVFAGTENWEVELRLISGHGQVVSHFLANPTALTFPLNEGKAFICGLKFLAVSSRNGGHFELEATVKNAGAEGANIPPCRSPELNILSERLKNEHKAESILDLKADDPLVRAPGIGKKYAEKLAAQGLHTVRDLADIDNSPASRERRVELLNAVRRDRGALTEAKLAEMLRDAKAVVKRDDPNQHQQQHPNAVGAAAAAPLLLLPRPTAPVSSSSNGSGSSAAGAKHSNKRAATDNKGGLDADEPAAKRRKVAPEHDNDHDHDHDHLSAALASLSKAAPEPLCPSPLVAGCHADDDMMLVPMPDAVSLNDFGEVDDFINTNGYYDDAPHA